MGSPEGQGDDDEQPQHEVTFAAPFRVAAVPVTNAQYQVFDPEHDTETGSGIEDEELKAHPVVNVTWFEAMAFTRWLAVTVPALRGARLATEAEWEYACRAGTDTLYWSGNEEADLARVAWYDGNADGRIGSARSLRIRGACTTCTVMSTNGCKIAGTTITTKRPPTALPGWRPMAVTAAGA